MPGSTSEILQRDGEDGREVQSEAGYPQSAHNTVIKASEVIENYLKDVISTELDYELLKRNKIEFDTEVQEFQASIDHSKLDDKSNKKYLGIKERIIRFETSVTAKLDELALTDPKCISYQDKYIIDAEQVDSLGENAVEKSRNPTVNKEIATEFQVAFFNGLAQFKRCYNPNSNDMSWTSHISKLHAENMIKFENYVGVIQDSNCQFGKRVTKEVTHSETTSLGSKDSVKSSVSCSSSVRRKLDLQKKHAAKQFELQRKIREAEFKKAELEAEIKYNNEMLVIQDSIQQVEFQGGSNCSSQNGSIRHKQIGVLLVQNTSKENKATPENIQCNLTRPKQRALPPVEYTPEENEVPPINTPPSYTKSPPTEPKSTDPPINYAPITNPSNYNTKESTLLKMIELIKVFDGSPSEYMAFESSFNKRIHDAPTFDYLDKLDLLEKLTSGHAQELVASCKCGPDKRANYELARKLLKSQYGRDEQIAETFVKKLREMKPIQAGKKEGLAELERILIITKNQVMNTREHAILDGKSLLVVLHEKLPRNLREKWIDKQIKIWDEEKRPETYNDFADFVSLESRKHNNLYYKLDLQRDSGSASNSQTKKAITSLVTEAKTTSNPRQRSERTPNCYYCNKQGHYTSNCITFSRLSVEQKVEAAIQKQLCFRCIGKYVKSHKCFFSIHCSICNRRHVTAMHEVVTKYEQEKDANKASNELNEPQTDQSGASSIKVALKTNKKCKIGEEKLASPILPALVEIEGCPFPIAMNVAIDTHCKGVFMDEEMMMKFGDKFPKECIEVSTMLATQAKSTYVAHNVTISDLQGLNRSKISTVYSQDPWPFTKEDIPNAKDIKNHDHLSQIPFVFLNAPVGMLIGVSNANLAVPIDIVRSPDPVKPAALRYSLGWTYQGTINSNSNSHSAKFCLKTNLKRMDTMYQDVINREFLDTKPLEIAPSLEDMKWERKIKSSLKKLQSGNIQVGLPFKKEDKNITFEQNNGKQVLKRLVSLKKKLESKPEFYQEYQEFMEMMLKKGFAEEVPVNELNRASNKTWYLYHFPVYHKQKKKLRIVFDASLRYNGTSLNEELITGPNLTSNLLGVLLRFREYQFALSADIEKMFYAVKVDPKHKDFLRFFWFPNGNLERDPQEYRVTVHLFGAASSPAIANFVLQQTAVNTKEPKYSIEAKDSIKNNFYVDDFLKSAKSEEELSTITKEVADIIRTGANFNLTSYSSNSRKILSQIPEPKLSKNLEELDLHKDKLPDQRTLGIYWKIEKDELGFKINLPDKPNTKRGVLSVVHSIHDVLGLVAPALLPAKITFQRCCKAKLDWDERLPLDLQGEWEKWKDSILDLTNFMLPRCLLPQSSSSVQLHIFSDGSEKAYGSVAYLRSYLQGSLINCSLVLSKSRLVPLKESSSPTIPRIELAAAKLSVQISLILNKELSIEANNTYFWTDSTAVIKYIKSENGRFHRYVAHRTSFIRENSDLEFWRYVNSEDNPANLISRGTDAKQLNDSVLWKNGPLFLSRSQEDWPKNIDTPTLLDSDNEVIKSKMKVLVTSCQLAPTDKFLSISSSFYQTKSRVASLQNLVDTFKAKKNREEWPRKVTAKDLEKAEITIWKYVQKANFQVTFTLIQQKKNLPANNALAKLKPILSDGVLRVGGRLHNAPIPEEQKHPIILPNHHLTEILIRQEHIKLGHMGKATIINKLREKYWILGVGRLVKRIIHNCIHCRKTHGRPSCPQMSTLPQDRVTPDQPVFSHIGIDVFGPYELKIKRSIEKRYVMVITCLASRAVHLEPLGSMDTSSCINALRRFIARRGLPSVIRSDQGTNFIGAQRELKTELENWNSSHAEEWLKQENIQWEFNVPTASNFGGVWERLIRTCRNIMNGLMKSQLIKLDDELFGTLLCEVESVMNSRPITPLSDDPDDLRALTPQHLLQAHAGFYLAPGLFSNTDQYSRRRWKVVQDLTNQFWKRWQREYLPLLQVRSKWHQEKTPMKTGDLVLLTDSNLPRNCWSLGRVTEVFDSNDHQVQKVKLKIARVRGELKDKVTEIERPVNKLILLRDSENL